MKPFAFVFPGQGSQSVGMLDAWGAHPVVKQALDGAVRSGQIQPGQTVLLEGVGGGFAWGAVLLTM